MGLRARPVRKPSKMIRSKKEFRCSRCDAKSIKFAGFCKACGAAGTMVERQLIPVEAKPKATLSQKGLIRRAKVSERNISRRMQEVDGPDPLYKNVASSTGRVGHITGMQIDSISLNYVIENKNRALPVWINKAWIQILQRASDFGKHALLHIEPSNIVREYPVNGIKKKTDTMAIITQTRHESLIMSEKVLYQVREILDSGESNVVRIRKIMDVVGGHQYGA